MVKRKSKKNEGLSKGTKNIIAWIFLIVGGIIGLLLILSIFKVI